MSMSNPFSSLIRKFRFFASQQPSFSLWLVFFSSLPVQSILSVLNRFRFLWFHYYRYVTSRDFTSTWFDQNISLFWIVLALVRLFNSFRNSPLVCTELGSWEGRSSLFILHSLPSAKLYCVDTWEGADEHQELSQLVDVEKRFLCNLRPYIQDSSCHPCRMTTLDFFISHSSLCFDFCYLDASHSYPDALVDIFNIVPLMKPFSLLVFDDYLWNYYDNPLSNCGYALNVFMKTSTSRTVIPLFVSYQVVLLIV